jgi:hypothetical protein
MDAMGVREADADQYHMDSGLFLKAALSPRPHNPDDRRIAMGPMIPNGRGAFAAPL